MPWTEADELLRAGALYRRRVGWRANHGTLAFLGFKDAAFSIYWDDAPILHCDLEGRWQRAYLDDAHWLRSLDGRAVRVDRDRDPRDRAMSLRRAELDPAQTRALDDRVRALVRDLADQWDRGALRVQPPPETARTLESEHARAFLDRILAWDADAAARDADLARALRPPSGRDDVPPAIRGAIRVEPVPARTFADFRAGDADGRQTAPPRSPEQFARHLDDLRRLWRSRARQARALFLDGGPATRLDPSILHPLLDELLQRFPLHPHNAHPDPEQPRFPAGIHAFLDDFRSPFPPVDEWRRLRERGLARIHLGLESGAPELRAPFGRTWTDDELLDAARTLKQAGVPLDVVALLGVGGLPAADRHRDATAALLARLPLERGDLVSLVEPGDAGPEANAAWERFQAPRLAGPPWEQAARHILESLKQSWNQRPTPPPKATLARVGEL